MKRNWSFFIYGVMIVALIIAIRQVPAISRFFSHTASYILYPVLVVERTFIDPIKGWYRQRRDVDALITKMHQAEERCAATLQENIALQATLATYGDIQELVEFKNRYSTTQLVYAPILLKQFGDAQHYMFLEAGANRGIEPDMVAVYKNCIIGRITHVYPCYSKMLLCTDRTCKIPAVCAKTGAHGIHEGNQDCHGTTLSFVSHLTTVKEGDLVLSSGEGLIFPRGFALGRIRSCKADGLHYAIDLEPLVDLRSLTGCYILAKGSVYQEHGQFKHHRPVMAEIMPPVPQEEPAEPISAEEVTITPDDNQILVDDSDFFSMPTISSQAI